MPKFLRKFESTAYVNNNSIEIAGNALCYTKSMDFLNRITDKLSALTVALKKQFETLRNQIRSPARGAVLASVTVRTIPLGVKYEYLIYIQQYGPPPDGIFNEDYLTIIRREHGIITSI